VTTLSSFYCTETLRYNVIKTFTPSPPAPALPLNMRSQSDDNKWLAQFKCSLKHFVLPGLGHDFEFLKRQLSLDLNN